MKKISSVLVVLFALAFSAGAAEASTVTVWSENAASCVPTGSFGVNISAGAITAGGSTTVVLYCPVTKAQVDAGAINHIEITYKGNTGAGGVGTSAQLVSLSKSTGSETVMGTVTSSSASSITTVTNTLSSNTFDWNNNFYYVRVTLVSGSTTPTLQTLYGVSLTFV